LAARTRPTGEGGRQGRRALAGADRRSRLTDTLDALLRAPLLTPKALADELRIASHRDRLSPHATGVG
jgi:hypothetical protein